MPPPPLLRAGMVFVAAAAAAALRYPHLSPKLSQYGALDVLAQSPLSSSPFGHRLLPHCAIPRLARGWRTPAAVPLCSVTSEAPAFDGGEEEELKIKAEEERWKRKNVNDDDDEDTFLNYGEPGFWDKTYVKENEPLEWYQSYGDMAPLVRQYIPFSSRVLMAGCGNAEMSEHMVNDGYNDIVNIDNSSIVIENMKKKYQNTTQLKYLTMDVTNLSFDDGSFDSVIDKGTLDAIMCVAGGPYSIPMMIAEVNRILKPGGVYMLITTGDPKSRLPLLNASVFHWNITLYVIPKVASKTAVKGCSEAYSEPVSLNADGTYATKHVLEKEDHLFVFVCIKP